MAKKTRTPEPFPEAAPKVEAPAERVLTVNGKPIPVEFAHAIPYAQTDQGIAERQAAQEGKPRRMVEVLREPLSKQIEEYGAQPWDAGAKDPITEVVDKVREPGFAYKALSPRVMDRRGMRGFEVVPGVKFGNMLIGRMPISERTRRNEHYRQEGLERQQSVEAAYQEAQEELAQQEGVAGFGPVPLGEVLTDARDPERAASIGISRTRG